MTIEDDEDQSTQPGEPYTRRIREDESPSLAVVRAVGASQNVASEEIDPLAWSIDPDALDAVVSAGDGATVEFDYAGVHVTVDPQSVMVYHPDDT